MSSLTVEHPPVAVSRTAVFSYTLFRSIDLAGTDWDAAAPPHDLFLQRPYLRTLEQYAPEGMRFGYLVFYCNRQPVGVAYLQGRYFQGHKSVPATEEPQPFGRQVLERLRRSALCLASWDVLVCGNAFATGEHSFWYDDRHISAQQFASLLDEAMQSVSQRWERTGCSRAITIVKDIAPGNVLRPETLTNAGFHTFEIQPNMVLELPYADFDAYLAAMSTKYRTRAKRAFKKLAELEKKELTLADMERENARMRVLYQEVARGAGFNFAELHERYFIALKGALPDAFRVYAYYLNGQMVAFYTTLVNYTNFEAHFLGYDKTHNHEYQLYLNILYDIVRLAIDSGARRVAYARTALEIKSSVGAVGQPLCCFARHPNTLVHQVLGYCIRNFTPEEQWQPRHPFKAEGGL
jgi:Acetyltransferase (GNAT) domain